MKLVRGVRGVEVGRRVRELGRGSMVQWVVEVGKKWLHRVL